MLTVFSLLYLVPVLSNIAGPPKPRFRKRDKVMFYGRKMLRKVTRFDVHISYTFCTNRFHCIVHDLFCYSASCEISKCAKASLVD